MKVAVLHNFMDNIGGAEKVGLTLARDLEADMYSTNVNQHMIAKMGFGVRVHSIGRIPINAPFRQQLALLRFRHVKFKKHYDAFIIDGDWAMSAAVKNKPNIWYVHSPIREIWDLYRYTRTYTVPWYLRFIFDIWVHYNRYLNKKYVKQVDALVCNSTNVQRRIKKYLGREAKVIHPPIDTKKFTYNKNGDFWLSVNRLISHKRVELQLEAFAQLPREKLVIVGSYEQSRHFKQYKEKIQRLKPKNVTIINHATDEEIKELYANCKGFITTAQNEDFGMTPVEAMASGKPVIAPAQGGYLETVVDGKTGVLIKDITAKKLVEAILDVAKRPERYKKACQQRAKEFDTSVFIKKIREELEIITG